jgi:hypothetical protein
VTRRLLGRHDTGDLLKIRAEVLTVRMGVDVAEPARDSRPAGAHGRGHFAHLHDTTRSSTTGQRPAAIAYTQP